MSKLAFRKMTGVVAGLGALFASATWGAPEVHAQELLLGATLEGASGVEGGGRDVEGVRRARTLLRVGGDARIDESPKDILSAGLLLELEPRVSAGADLRYVRMFGERVAIHVGATAFIVPEQLVGATVGLAYRIPMSDKLDFTVGPTIPVYFLGSDMPPGNVIWQALLQAGFRADI